MRPKKLRTAGRAGSWLAFVSSLAMACAGLSAPAWGQSITPRPASDSGGSGGSGASGSSGTASSGGTSSLVRQLTDDRAGVGGRSFSIEPRISARMSFGEGVDSVGARGGGSRGFDVVGTISPGVAVRAQRPRINGFLDYSLDLRSDFGTRNNAFNEQDVRHNLLARFGSELIDDFFFVDAGGVITRVPRSLRRGNTIINDFDDSNTLNVNNFFVSPRIQGRFFDFAQWSLGYSLNGNFYTRTNDRFQRFDPSLPAFQGGDRFGDPASNSLNNSFNGQIQSGPQFGNLQWTLRGGYELSDRDFLDGEYRAAQGGLDLEYALTRRIRLLGSVGYEDIRDTENDILIDPVTRQVRFDPATGRVLEDPNNRNLLFDDSGMFWDVGFRLVPSRRTNLFVRGGQRYGDVTFSGGASSQLTRRLSAAASYSDTITNDGRLFSQRLSGLALTPDGTARVSDPGAVTSSLGTSRRSILGTSSFFLFDPTTGFLLLGDQSVNSVTFRQRTAQLGFTYAAPRSSARLDFFYNRRVPLRLFVEPGQVQPDPAVLARERQTSFGVNSGYSFEVQRNQTLSADLGLRRYLFRGIDPRRDWELASSVGYSIRFSSMFSGEARLTHASRFTNTGEDERTDLVGTIGIEARF
jgi:hypothetical protein